LIPGIKISRFKGLMVPGYQAFEISEIKVFRNQGIQVSIWVVFRVLKF
jgi:hypothetical protein